MPVDALLNGEPAADSNLLDRACQFGDGLFETLAVRDGQPCLWSLHVQRLQQGCQRLGLPPPDLDLLLSEARLLCDSCEQAVLKIIISAGKSVRGYARPETASHTRWLRCSPWPGEPPWTDEHPLQVQKCHTRLGAQPMLAGIKHLNRLEQVLARRELRTGAQEGLMRDQKGNVVEGIASNLLLMRETHYLTPRLYDCGVNGTVRQQLIDHSAALDRPLRIGTLELEDLYHGEALFMMNALMGIRPVAGLEEHRYPITIRPPALERLHQACFTFSGEMACND